MRYTSWMFFMLAHSTSDRQTPLSAATYKSSDVNKHSFIHHLCGNMNNMARLREVVLVTGLVNSWRQEVGCICLKQNLLKRDMASYLMHLLSIGKGDKASQPNL